MYNGGHTLRPYQIEGLNWLLFSWYNRRSVMLASGRYALLDDGMGFSLVPWRPIIEPRLGQQIAAGHLGPGSACLVVSGSGANRASLDVVTQARASGARVLAITSFPRSPVAEAADVSLIVAPVNDSFHDELVHTSRAALMLVTESVVGLLVARRGESARAAQAATLSVLSRSLSE